MVTDKQARRLKKMLSEGKKLSLSAAKAGSYNRSLRIITGISVIFFHTLSFVTI